MHTQQRPTQSPAPRLHPLWLIPVALLLLGCSLVGAGVALEVLVATHWEAKDKPPAPVVQHVEGQPLGPEQCLALQASASGPLFMQMFAPDLEFSVVYQESPLCNASFDGPDGPNTPVAFASSFRHRLELGSQTDIDEGDYIVLRPIQPAGSDGNQSTHVSGFIGVWPEGPFLWDELPIRRARRTLIPAGALLVVGCGVALLVAWRRSSASTEQTQPLLSHP
eukprot:m51a1_g9896 hypothetical protein (222) ;mRNA; r:58521-59186